MRLEPINRSYPLNPASFTPHYYRDNNGTVQEVLVFMTSSVRIHRPCGPAWVTRDDGTRYVTPSASVHNEAIFDGHRLTVDALVSRRSL